MNQPLVSVIIPNYNHARYLEQRLDSVFNQTYQNFEVIILDDHSTDNSLGEIDHYKDNPHLSQIVVNEKNSGSTFKQWDKGIHLAQGEIIWIAESDDYCELNMLEELVKAYTIHPNIVLAYSTSIMVDENGEKGSVSKYSWECKVFNSRSYLTKFLAYGCTIRNASSAIFSKQVALNVSPTYMSFRGSGDYMFWAEIVSQGSVAIVDKQMNSCRRSIGTVTNKNYISGNMAAEDMKVYEYISSLFPRNYFQHRLIFASHASQYRGVPFESQEAKEKCFQIWQIEKHSSSFDKLLLWIRSKLRIYLNIYI